MKSTNRNQLTVKFASRTRYFPKENPMNRRMITVILTSLLFAFFALSAAPAFAQDAIPSDVDTADQAYLQEYQQRAVEKYRSMQATQAAKNAAVSAASTPDWGGEMFVTEYAQKSQDAYAAIRQPARSGLANSTQDWGGEMFVAEYAQKSQDAYAAIRQPARSGLANSTPDWGGEMFVAEYAQKSQEQYQQWLASQDGSVAGQVVETKSR